MKIYVVTHWFDWETTATTFATREAADAHYRAILCEYLAEVSELRNPQAHHTIEELRTAADEHNAMDGACLEIHECELAQ